MGPKLARTRSESGYDVIASTRSEGLDSGFFQQCICFVSRAVKIYFLIKTFIPSSMSRLSVAGKWFLAIEEKIVWMQ